MLPQTRRAVEALKDAGLTRSQFRVHTPWKRRRGEIVYGETIIVLLIPFSMAAPYIPKLAKSFKVIVDIYDGTAGHVSIETKEPGLFKFEHGKTEPVNEIVVDSCYEQLLLWQEAS